MSCGNEGDPRVRAALEQLGTALGEPRALTGARARTSAAAPREFVHAIVATATLAEVSGPGDWVQVVGGGGALIFLRFDTGGGPIRLRARAGATYMVPHRKLTIEYAAGLATGSTLELVQGDGEPPAVPHVAAELAVWEDFVRVTGPLPGNGTVPLVLPEGYEYDVDAIMATIVNDATAANRVLHVDVYDPTAADLWARHCIVANIVASQTGLLTLVPGGAGSLEETHTAAPHVFNTQGIFKQKFKVSSVPGVNGQYRAFAAAGVVGDLITIRARGRRRIL